MRLSARQESSLEDNQVASKAIKEKLLKHLIQIYWPLDLFMSDLSFHLYLHNVT